MHSFEVHSNESACRKKVRLGLKQVYGGLSDQIGFCLAYRHVGLDRKCGGIYMTHLTSLLSWIQGIYGESLAEGILNVGEELFNS